MRTLEIDDIVESFKEIRMFLGTEWLSDELKKLNGQTPNKNPRKHNFLRKKISYHPFALTWKNALNQLDLCLEKERLIVSHDLLQVVVLGSYFSRLKFIKLVNSEGEMVGTSIQELKRRFKNPDEYDNVKYELQIASVYSFNYNTNFIKTSSKKTPDLYIKLDDSMIQIECKKKEDMSKRDKTNKLHWDELAIKILNFMAESDSNYLSIIRFDKDPTDISAKQCLFYTIELLKQQKEGIFKHKLGFSVELKKIAENDEILTSSFTEDLKKDEYFESEYVSFQSSEEGISKTSLIKNPKIICFKSKELPDRVNSIIRTIRKAKKQLRSDSPGIIYIEINPNNFQSQDFDILERKIKEHLSDSINAIVLTKAPDVKINDEFGQYTHKSQVILNENCKFTLPEKFEIMGTSKGKVLN